MAANIGNTWDDDHAVASDLDSCIPCLHWCPVASSQKDGGDRSYTRGFGEPQTWLTCAFNLLKVDNIVINS